MRTGSRAPLATALVIAGLVGLLWAPAQAGEKAAPVKVFFGVDGLDPDGAKALQKSLKSLESVQDAHVDVKGAEVQVKAEKTLRLSDVDAAVAALSTDAKKLALRKADTTLTGTVTLTVVGSSDDTAVADAIRSAPNVEDIAGSGGTFEVKFAGAKGATIREIEDALKAKLPVAEGAEPPSVKDVAWTAPKGDDGGKHG